VLAIGVFCQPAHRSLGADPRPNIVLIMADDN
jgi:hypothetical protein